jgi:hypothetical protein
MAYDGKKHQQNRDYFRSPKFACVPVLTLSRRKQGFESPRERQGVKNARFTLISLTYHCH